MATVDDEDDDESGGKCPPLLDEERKGLSVSGRWTVPLELLIEPVADGDDDVDNIDAVFEYWGAAADGTNGDDTCEGKAEDDDDEEAADGNAEEGGTIDDEDGSPRVPDCDSIDGGNWVESGKVVSLWCMRGSLCTALVVATGLDCV